MDPNSRPPCPSSPYPNPRASRPDGVLASDGSDVRAYVGPTAVPARTRHDTLEAVPRIAVADPRRAATVKSLERDASAALGGKGALQMLPASPALQAASDRDMAVEMPAIGAEPARRVHSGGPLTPTPAPVAVASAGARPAWMGGTAQFGNVTDEPSSPAAFTPSPARAFPVDAGVTVTRTGVAGLVLGIAGTLTVLAIGVGVFFVVRARSSAPAPAVSTTAPVAATAATAAKPAPTLPTLAVEAAKPAPTPVATTDATATPEPAPSATAAPTGPVARPAPVKATPTAQPAPVATAAPAPTPTAVPAKTSGRLF